MSDLIAPASVADFLLFQSRECGEILTNLKLQKLIYYAQAWYLALNNRSLFDEDMEAWVHGPVLPSQYHRFSAFAWKPILSDIQNPDLSKSAGVADHLTEILDVFGSETAVALELMTHRETPWLEARGGLAPDAISRNKISKTSMRDYYRAMR
jgi:uncharacterized phage-associated protein